MKFAYTLGMCFAMIRKGKEVNRNAQEITTHNINYWTFKGLLKEALSKLKLER